MDKLGAAEAEQTTSPSSVTVKLEEPEQTSGEAVNPWEKLEDIVAEATLHFMHSRVLKLEFENARASSSSSGLRGVELSAVCTTVRCVHWAS